MKIPRLIHAFISHKLPCSAKDKLYRLWRGGIGASPPIYDLGELSPDTGITKRALLSFTTAPFTSSPKDDKIAFSGTQMTRAIVNVLNELDYIVDVVECTDTRFKPRRHYDLFLGHGGYNRLNFEGIARKLACDTVKIYLSTGPCWKFHNEREMARLKALRERRGVNLPPDRHITASDEWACRNADGIITPGNTLVRETYSKPALVLSLNTASYPDDHYDRTEKDFAAGRANFLFYAGRGNVHKGLDLLLEAFTRVDAHLYICQKLNPDFVRVYRRELEEYPNIHTIGFIPMRSAESYNLVNRCNFAIHPSCSDGCPRSVVECMNQGLIPVVSRESFIDTDDYGVVLSTCAIEEIIEVVLELSHRPAEWCQEMSQRARRAAVTKFSVPAYSQNMKDAIQYIVAGKASQEI